MWVCQMIPAFAQLRGQSGSSLSGLDDAALQTDNDCMGAIIRP
jgi:hypothetical protein